MQLAPELRIICMTKDEYNAAMKKFTQSQEEIDDYRDYLMTEFNETYNNGIEIASTCDLGTQYYAVIADGNAWLNDGRLYELPESFIPEGRTTIHSLTEELEKYVKDKNNTDKIEMSVLQLNRIINALNSLK